MSPGGIAGHLHTEHERMLRMLEVLEQLTVRAAEDGVRAVIETVLGFLAAQATCHHQKEETILFPLLSARGLPNSVEALIRDHSKGLLSLAEVHRTLAEIPRSLQEFRQAIGAYDSFYREHIDKEDTYLLPAIPAQLTEEEEANMLEEFLSFEEEYTGEDGWTDLEREIDRLAKELL